MRNKYVPEGKEGKGGRNKTDEFHKRRMLMCTTCDKTISNTLSWSFGKALCQKHTKIC